MTTPQDKPATQSDQREALSDSERAASREQPENFKDVETDQKVIEIGPIDREGDAIKGLDPDK